MRARRVVGWSFVVFAVWSLAPVRAQEAAANPNWDLKLGFSYLATSGNTATSSAGFDGRYVRDWKLWGLEAATRSPRGMIGRRAPASHWQCWIAARRPSIARERR